MVSVAVESQNYLSTIYVLKLQSENAHDMQNILCTPTLVIEIYLHNPIHVPILTGLP